MAKVNSPSRNSNPIGTQKYQYIGLCPATCQMAMAPCAPNRTRVIIAFVDAINFVIMVISVFTFPMQDWFYLLDILSSIFVQKCACCHVYSTRSMNC